MKNYFQNVMMLAVAAAMIFAACSKDDEVPAPTVGVDFSTDELVVTFTTIGKNVDTYLWDFGDDTTSDEANPVHEYPYSGTYDVTLLVEGEGGEKTIELEITVSDEKMDLLTGGADAVNGKTWVFSEIATDIDGAYPIEYPLGTRMAPSFNNILGMFGIQEEYDNEFTFYNDGSYKVDNVNGISLAGVMYGVYHMADATNIVGDIILSTVKYTTPASSTFTMGEESFDIVVRQEDVGVSPTVVSDVETLSFTDVLTLSFSEGAYFGLLDFYTSRVIIDKITADRMEILVFVCTLNPNTYPDDYSKPSVFVRMTFVPKQ
jgi:PKD repeat protein